MRSCYIKSCNKKNKSKDVKLFKLPKNESMCAKWLNVIEVNFNKIKRDNVAICSRHFEKKFLIRDLQSELTDFSRPRSVRLLREDAIPSLFLNEKEQVENIIQPTEQPTEPENSQTLIMVLENKIKLMAQEIENLKKELKEKDTRLQELRETTISKTCLESILTEGQIRRLTNFNKRIRWGTNDIAMAVSLKSVSAKAYNYLRNKRNLPLPSASTLRRWVANLNLKPGIIEYILPQMEIRAMEFNCVEKLCVLSFDEIYIKQTISIEKKHQKVIGPHRSCQVALVRGLCSKWKQPLFFDFDFPMQPQTLFNIISQLYAIGFIVVAVVHDMGTTNVAIWNKLNVGPDINQKCFVAHPSNDDLKVFFFADAPHLLKLIRNHFIDRGFMLNDNAISTECVKEILKLSVHDYKLTPKLTTNHLTLQGVERQKVKPAAQLLSNTVSCAIRHLKNKNLITAPDWAETSDFIKLSNDWFDVLNSTMKFGKHEGVKAFGLRMECQTNILHQMSQVMEILRVKNKNTKQPFQKGILLTNASLKGLYGFLKEKFNIEYILTARLNQDVLEQLFSNLRSKGGQYDHPNALDFQYRLKWYLLGKCNESILTGNTEVNHVEDEMLSSALADINKCELEEETQSEILSNEHDNNLDFVLYSYMSKKYSTGPRVKFKKKETPETLTLREPSEGEWELLDLLETSEKEEEINREVMAYVAGYVAYKFQNTFPEMVERNENIENSSWIWIKGMGKLCTPSKILINATIKLENEFQLFHGDSLAKEDLIFDKLAALIGDIPYEVAHCMVRTRTYIRLNELNKKSSLKIKTHSNKKIRKFIV